MSLASDLLQVQVKIEAKTLDREILLLDRQLRENGDNVTKKQEEIREVQEELGGLKGILKPLRNKAQLGLIASPF